MSTITMATPRQPFACLSGARLRTLTNSKNKQNAMPSTMAGPLKRHAPNDFDDIDTENIDPLMISLPSKKARTFDFELTKSDKTPLFTLTPSKTPAQSIERSQVAGQKRKAEDSITPTNANGTQKHQRIAPSSAPARAGRSPKSKKIGILSRRRMTSSPFTRINPPAFSLGESQTPFSIDAALAGTVPTYKSKSTHRKGWHFDIHEDTPEDEMANLMEHSTCTLDISDDESASHKGDKDNKENIPPVDGPAAIGYSSTQITSTRRDMMTDEPRTPLGDLDAQVFYAEGCNASSVIIVSADDVADCANEKATAAASNVEEPFTPSRSRANIISKGRECWKEIVAQLAADLTATNNLPLEQEASKQEAADIQIWESASAKGDDEVHAQDSAADDISGQPQLA